MSLLNPPKKFTRGTLASLVLLFGSFGLVLVVPLFPQDISQFLFFVFYTIIFLASTFALRPNKMFRIAVYLIIAFQVFGLLFEFDRLVSVLTQATIAMFAWVVVKLMIDIIKKDEVSGEVLMDAISVYMMLGIMFGLFGQIILAFYPDAYTYNDQIELETMFYFTFVTMTTLGYGEMVPVMPLAKSLAVLTAITGQFYLTLVIAVLVGKYLSPIVEDQSS
jgi:hypothetical protein